MIEVTPKIHLSEDDLEFRFKRASGPGGQHVNKTDTAVELRFAIESCSALPPEVRERLHRLARKRISREGILIIHAQRFRSQERNREDALARLVELLVEASYRPAPRIATRPTRGARERRLADKKRVGETKRGRGKVKE
jgi:ribosome-associated protein